MVAEYIEREALIERIVNTPSEVANKAFEQKEYSFSLTLDRLVDRQHEIIDMIEDAPAADVAPVVHGRWVNHTKIHGFVYCSACRDVYLDAEWLKDGKWGYCPNCGAKMDGDKS